MYSFAYSKYTEDGATKLATETCRRLEWWLQVSSEFVADTDEFTDAVLETYPGHDDFKAWLNTVPLGSALAKRAATLLSLRPKRVELGPPAALTLPFHKYKRNKGVSARWEWPGLACHVLKLNGW